MKQATNQKVVKFSMLAISLNILTLDPKYTKTRLF